MIRRVSCVLLLAAAGCDVELPGEPVGTFEVTGALEDNGCGAMAVPAPDPIAFDVEIRADAPLAYWQLSGSRSIEGRVDDEGEYVFRYGTRKTLIEPDDREEVRGCAIEWSETLTLVVAEAPPDPDAGPGPADAGAAPGPMTLHGTHAIDVSPVAGGDCTRALLAFGGPFRALPCGLSYKLDGATR